MTSQAKSGIGSELKRVTTLVPELTSITGPGHKANLLEVTNMDSPDNYGEWIPGFLDGGEITAEGNFTAVAAQMALLTDLQNRTLTAYTLAIGDPAIGTYSFNAYVTSFETTLKFNEKIVFSFTLKVVGKPSFA